jgi:monovalent cation/proton antiporter MnhG/PhaG subunit
VTDVLVWTLVVLGTVVQVLCVLGVLLARDPYDRLHFTGPASTVAPAAFALAVLLDEGPISQAGVKSVLTALALIVLNGVLVHATARAARIREHGSWRLLPEEREEAGA